jgi:hypothetical protein
LFMLNTLPSETDWPKSAFIPWHPQQPDYYCCAKWISQRIMKAILKAMSGLNVEIIERSMANVPERSQKLKLPITPGLPFLLALGDLFHNLRKEYGNMFEDRALVVVFGALGTQLTIPLRRESAEDFELAIEWVRKMESGAGRLEDGICGSLWGVVRARLWGLKNKKRSDNEDKLLRIFDGHDRPVVGVNFAPHFLHLYWN